MSPPPTIPKNGTEVTINTESNTSITGTIKSRDEYTTDTDKRTTATLQPTNGYEHWQLRIIRDPVTSKPTKQEIWRETDATNNNGNVTGVKRTAEHTITEIKTS